MYVYEVKNMEFQIQINRFGVAKVQLLLIKIILNNKVVFYATGIKCGPFICPPHVYMTSDNQKHYLCKVAFNI